MQHTPEEVLKNLALCFNSSFMDSREVGAGDADKLVVRMAWHAHRMLDTSARHKGTRDTAMLALSLTLTLLSTLASILVPFLQASDSHIAKLAVTSDYWFYGERAVVV